MNQKKSVFLATQSIIHSLKEVLSVIKVSTAHTSLCVYEDVLFAAAANQIEVLAGFLFEIAATEDRGVEAPDFYYVDEKTIDLNYFFEFIDRLDQIRLKVDDVPWTAIANRSQTLVCWIDRYRSKLPPRKRNNHSSS
jgi:hypothetical protein